MQTHSQTSFGLAPTEQRAASHPFAAGLDLLSMQSVTRWAATCATTWAESQLFDEIRIDCTTTVVLKILDGKCKMLPGEQHVLLAIYDVVGRETALFGHECHAMIRVARAHGAGHEIHQLRLKAEAAIAKPIMKRFKAFLRESLFSALADSGAGL